MADFSQAKPIDPSQNKSLQDDEILKEKKSFANEPWKPVAKSNPSFNKPGYGGGGKFGGARLGGGRPTIRKHAARSR